MTSTEEKEVKNQLQSVYNSCFEGYTGQWDCSTEEGKEGFLSMQECLEKVCDILRINLKKT